MPSLDSYIRWRGCPIGHDRTVVYADLVKQWVRRQRAWLPRRLQPIGARRAGRSRRWVDPARTPRSTSARPPIGRRRAPGNERSNSRRHPVGNVVILRRRACLAVPGIWAEDGHTLHRDPAAAERWQAVFERLSAERPGTTSQDGSWCLRHRRGQWLVPYRDSEIQPCRTARNDSSVRVAGP